jgi:hypothetical protein
MDVLTICQKVERATQLNFGKFDEAFHGLAGAIIYSIVD